MGHGRTLATGFVTFFMWLEVIFLSSYDESGSPSCS